MNNDKNLLIVGALALAGYVVYNRFLSSNQGAVINENSTAAPSSIIEAVTQPAAPAAAPEATYHIQPVETPQDTRTVIDQMTQVINAAGSADPKVVTSVLEMQAALARPTGYESMNHPVTLINAAGDKRTVITSGITLSKYVEGLGVGYNGGTGVAVLGNEFLQGWWDADNPRPDGFYGFAPVWNDKTVQASAYKKMGLF